MQTRDRTRGYRHGRRSEPRRVGALWIRSGPTPPGSPRLKRSARRPARWGSLRLPRPPQPSPGLARRVPPEHRGTRGPLASRCLRGWVRSAWGDQRVRLRCLPPAGLGGHDRLPFAKCWFRRRGWGAPPQPAGPRGVRRRGTQAVRSMSGRSCEVMIPV